LHFFLYDDVRELQILRIGRAYWKQIALLDLFFLILFIIALPFVKKENLNVDETCAAIPDSASDFTPANFALPLNQEQCTLDWPSKSMQKYAEAIVVSLKQYSHVFDARKQDWHEDETIRLYGFLRNINLNIKPNLADLSLANPSTEKRSNLRSLNLAPLYSDPRIAALIIPTTFGFIDHITVGPGQIFRLAEVLAENLPFNLSGIQVQDPSPDVTEKLLVNVLLRAKQANITYLYNNKKQTYNFSQEEQQALHARNTTAEINNFLSIMGPVSVFVLCLTYSFKKPAPRYSSKVRPIPEDLLRLPANARYRAIGYNS
jgi:hypothetical protein